MIIQSKFKDYYDFCSRHGVDKTIVYRRTQESFLDLEIDKIVAPSRGYPFAVSNSHPKYLLEWIIFCNKAVAHFVRDNPYDKHGYHIDIERDMFFDSNTEEFTQFVQEQLYEGSNYGKNKVDDFARVFNTDWTDYHFKYKCPVFKVRKEAWAYENKVNIHTNPNLREIHFYKYKDTFSCYQEIAQFVGGVLGDAGREMVVPQDKYRIQAAGFDLKTSFRKDTPPKRKQKI